MGFYKKDERNRRSWTKSGVAALVIVGSVAGAGIYKSKTQAAFDTPKVSSQATSVNTAYQGQGTGSAGVSGISNLSTSVAGSESNAVTRVFQQASPAVVSVVNYQTLANPYTGQSSLQEAGVGSGIIFEKNSGYAYIVTNNHVIAGQDKLEVALKSGLHVTATLVGADPYTDLAVIRIPVNQVKSIQPVQFADSNTVQPGQLAIAIGSPGGLDFQDTVTSGIISGTSRIMPVEVADNSNDVLDYQKVLQTDAAINPGNSGGPLLNANGQVVGINSSKIVAQNFEGMGFAIPSDEVRTVVNEIMATGHVQHPALGISAASLTSVPQQEWPNVPVGYGVYVTSVDSSQAQKSGLKTGDVIVSFNGHTVQDEADLRTYLFQAKPGATATLTVYRGSQKLTLKVVLSTLNTPQNPSSASSAGSLFGGSIPASNGGNSQGYGFGG